MTEGEAQRPSEERFPPRPPQHLPPSPTRVAFSLFEGDLVNRIFSSFGIHGRRAVDLIARILILISVTWGVLAVLAVFVSKVAHGPAGENFFLDFAAYLQLLVGLPLFVIAERVIGEHTREAAGYFLAAGVIPPEELPTIEATNRKVERLRKSIVPDLVCLALAVVLALVTILPKEESSVCISWHTTPREAGASLATAKEHLRAECEERRTQAEKDREAGKKLKGPERELQEAAQELKSAAGELRASVRDGKRSEGKPADEQAKAKGAHPEVTKKLNFAGWWTMLVTLPILNYWWLRWIWKIALWSWFLYRMSRVPLILVPTHPDATGGIGFVSDVQTKFGLAILAFGISNIASTVGYELSIEHAPWSLHTVWGPLVFFVIGAPLVFTLPLFMFTKQLYRVKKRAREELYERMGDRARIFEDRWRKVEPSVSFNAELLQWHQLRTLYEHVEKMRIVPFDLRSFAELLVQTLGALVPLLGYLNLPEPVLNVLEHGTKMLH